MGAKINLCEQPMLAKLYLLLFFLAMMTVASAQTTRYDCMDILNHLKIQSKNLVKLSTVIPTKYYSYKLYVNDKRKNKWVVYIGPTIAASHEAAMNKVQNILSQIVERPRLVYDEQGSTICMYKTRKNYVALQKLYGKSGFTSVLD
jgi:hypothetical protein